MPWKEVKKRGSWKVLRLLNDSGVDHLSDSFHFEISRVICLSGRLILTTSNWAISLVKGELEKCIGKECGGCIL